MIAIPQVTRGLVYFCYANSSGFSGQKAATELVIKGLTRRAWVCRSLPQPVLDRTGVERHALGRYLVRLGLAWLGASRLLVARGSWLCVNLGQTRIAFLRDAIPLLLGRLVLGRSRIIVSLHGSLFMQWVDSSLDVRLFRGLLQQASMVTVLGERQRERLLSLGLSKKRVSVVVNSCDLEPLSNESVRLKHHATEEPKRPLRCLHLSSLIATKGFPDFLEALSHLCGIDGPKVEAVLCGRIVVDESMARFPNAGSPEEWIEQKLAEINRSERVRVRWIRGAIGAEKAALFRDADVFVLPTHYAVEAQPLVLLEAMASACAIVTTRVGEIPTILDESSALFVSEVSTLTLANALQSLFCDAASRASLGRAGHARFVERYQVDRHLDVWERLLNFPAAMEKGRS